MVSITLKTLLSIKDAHVVTQPDAPTQNPKMFLLILVLSPVLIDALVSSCTLLV